MTNRLTWEDLLIEDPDLKVEDLLADWRWLLNGRLRLIALSKFGDFFLERPDATVHVLDVLEGETRQIASSVVQFREFVNDPAWQEEHLLSEIVWELHQRGLIPGPGECYGFAPHPVFAGSVRSDQAVILSLVVWESLCGQLFASSESRKE